MALSDTTCSCGVVIPFEHWYVREIRGTRARCLHAGAGNCISIFFLVYEGMAWNVIKL